MPKDEYIMVINSCNSQETAHSIAESLVSKKLAACVNIINSVESVYQWQGKIEHEKEYLLLIKTQRTLFSQLKEAVQQLHPYELPEIIAVPIELGEENYLKWIESATLATEN